MRGGGGVQEGEWVGGCKEGGVWFGLGQGLCRTVSTPIRADTTGLGGSWWSGPKPCRTVAHPRTPRCHAREGDAAVPVRVAHGEQLGGERALSGPARHVGSHGGAAPGPDPACVGTTVRGGVSRCPRHHLLTGWGEEGGQSLGGPFVHGGATTTGPDATHPPAICQKGPLVRGLTFAVNMSGQQTTFV